MASGTKARTWLTFTGRAGTGILVTAVGAAAVLVFGSLVLPSITLTPTAAVVDTSGTTTRALVCNGSLLELGADPTQPLLALPVGSSTVVTQSADGVPLDAESFARENEQGSFSGASAGSGVMFETIGETAYQQAAAESETAATENLKGFTANQCVEPATETWLVGGTTTTGSSTILSLVNPGDVPATVFVTVFDTEGKVESLQTAGVVVAPQSQRTVSINGYAPDRASLAVQVVARGSKVLATLQESLVEGLTPAGVDTVQGVSKPANRLVVAGVRSFGGGAVDEHGHSGAGHTLRVLAPGNDGSVLNVIGVDAEGKQTKLLTEYLAAGKVTDLALEGLIEGMSTVLVEAEVPVVASITGSAVGAAGEDIAWFAPATEITREIAVAVPGGPSPELVVYNPNERVIDVQLVPNEAGGGQAAAQRLQIAAGASVRVPVASASGLQLVTEQPVFAALSFAAEGAVAGFAVRAPLATADAVRVYTR